MVFFYGSPSRLTHICFQHAPYPHPACSVSSQHADSLRTVPPQTLSILTWDTCLKCFLIFWHPTKSHFSQHLPKLLWPALELCLFSPPAGLQHLSTLLYILSCVLSNCFLCRKTWPSSQNRSPFKSRVCTLYLTTS